MSPPWALRASQGKAASSAFLAAKCRANSHAAQSNILKNEPVLVFVGLGPYNVSTNFRKI